MPRASKQTADKSLVSRNKNKGLDTMGTQEQAVRAAGVCHEAS